MVSHRLNIGKIDFGRTLDLSMILNCHINTRDEGAFVVVPDDRLQEVRRLLSNNGIKILESLENPQEGGVE